MNTGISEQQETEDKESAPPLYSLDSLSPLFQVQKTAYGGRGCFASVEISEGTTVWECERPLGFAITKDFSKEVCTWCFYYNNGRAMKFKKSSGSGRQSIKFCSAECLQSFEKYDSQGALAEVLLRLEQFSIGDHEEEIEAPLTREIIDGKWEALSAWGDCLPAKISKRQKFVPQKIDEDTYVELKYLASVLLEMVKGRNVELGLFTTLQSNEYEKIIKYPQMLNTALNAYKVAKLIFPQNWQHLITPDWTRSTLGKENGNAFGIWSPQVNNEYQEYLGFSLYPSASFFNHSCAPCLQKTRQGAMICFTASRDISPGEEIYISYGAVTGNSYAERQATLVEWFFDCCCTRCQAEAVETAMKNVKL